VILWLKIFSEIGLNDFTYSRVLACIHKVLCKLGMAISFRMSTYGPEKQSKTKDTTKFDQTGEVALIRYSQQSDFHRDIIKGSMRTQRRKIAILKLFQANLHSPLFLDRIDKFLAKSLSYWYK